MTHQVKDRRRDPRVTVWSPVSISTEDGPIEAQLRNLSLAGVGCTSRQDLAEMTKVAVVLELPVDPANAEDRLRMDLQGVVVRCRPLRRGAARRKYELAIYFPELSEEQREQLTTFIQKRSQFAD